jgi:murein DD-endopeptidase MepM/ murein hydrolase activator NlpD
MNRAPNTFMSKKIHLSPLILVTLCLCLVVITGVILLVSCSPAGFAGSTPKLMPAKTTPFTDERSKAINSALQEAIQGREDLLPFLIYTPLIQSVDFSQDGKTGLVWIEWIDPESKVLIPGELGLVIAKLNDDNQTWKLSFQVDPDWKKILDAVPTDMLVPELRARYTNSEQGIQKGPVLTGYRLPWESGKSKYLTGSIGHVFTYKTCPKDCLYAFDFADGTMFRVLAAKGGRVKTAVWKYGNGDHSHTNFLVLEDTSTNPVTYQVYYHLAQDSIPTELRISGAQVQQGQFIGLADNTGPSSGHHLHFHVHTNKYSFWGTSVDISFQDVPVNGGRPRTCLEARAFSNYGSQCLTNSLYTSGNSDTQLPTGGIKKPSNLTVVSSRTVKVNGWAKDDTSIASIQLMITTDGNWKPVGDPIKASPFTYSLDLCTLGIPDGDFFIYLQIKDKFGKQAPEMTGITNLIKEYDCSPTPTPTYTPPTPTLTRVPTRTKVPPTATKTAKPAKPKTTATKKPVNQTKTPYPTPEVPKLDPPGSLMQPEVMDNFDLILTWNGDGDERTQFYSSLKGPSDTLKKLDWQKGTSWEVGQLKAGEYTWTVLARNPGGKSQSQTTFKVGFSDPPPVSEMEPISNHERTTAILLRWKVISGLMKLDHFTIQFRENGSGWTDWSMKLPADKREVWFVGKLGKKYDFRIRAVDTNGIAEPWSDKPEATFTTEKGCEPDQYETAKKGGDDRAQGANELLPGVMQIHNFCPTDDGDWLTFSAKAGETYHFTADAISGSATIKLELRDGNGNVVINEDSVPVENAILLDSHSESIGKSTSLEWTAPEMKTYFLHLSSTNPDLAGTDVVYHLLMERVYQWEKYVFIIVGFVAAAGGVIGKLLKNRMAMPTQPTSNSHSIPQSTPRVRSNHSQTNRPSEPKKRNLSAILDALFPSRRARHDRIQMARPKK